MKKVLFAAVMAILALSCCKQVGGEYGYTIKDNKIFKGDSTDPKDCVLSYTGDFNASRLLFIAYHFTK